MFYMLSVYYNAPKADSDLDFKLSETLRSCGFTPVKLSWDESTKTRDMLFEREEGE